MFAFFRRLFHKNEAIPCWKKNCKVPDHIYNRNKVGYNKTLS